jgi:hypothetical protein
MPINVHTLNINTMNQMIKGKKWGIIVEVSLCN